MENAFTPCPVCSPARASFHTGRIPSAHGIHDHIGEQSAGAGHPGIAGQTSLAEVLQGQGYQTGLVGKWHLNHFRQAPPGWDMWFSNAIGTNARFRAQPFYEGADEWNCSATRRTTSPTAPCASCASATAAGRSSCSSASPTPTRRIPASRSAGCSATASAASPTCPACRRAAPTGGPASTIRPTPPSGARPNAQYYAAVSVIDEMAGRVLDELADQQAERDTLLVNTSDHGHMNGRHGLHSKGNGTTPQNFLEESIRSPRIRTRSTTGTATPPAPAPWPSSQRTWTSTHPPRRSPPQRTPRRRPAHPQPPRALAGEPRRRLT